MANPFEASGLSNYASSIIRTYVPIGVSLLAAWLAAKLGVILDEDTKASAVAAFVGIFNALYYALIRYIEIKVPKVGWLLGLAKMPGYAPTDPPAPSPGPNEDL